MDKGAIIKLDMISPYMGRYIEVSCLYQIKTNDGFITHTNIGMSENDFLNDRISAKEYGRKLNNLRKNVCF